ncbi:MAG: cytochrome c maturation protein CcmE [Nevskiaceae bacterium]
MTRRGQRMLGVSVLAIGIGIAATLTLTAFRKNLMNFYVPTDIVAGGVPVGPMMRLGGMVEPGSVKRGEGLKVGFTVADCVNRVAVRYEGLLPDLFREGQGVVASGQLEADRPGPDGSPGQMVFVATEVLAKHDENYMPPQVAESMKTPAGHSCAPFKPVGKPLTSAPS